MYSFDITVTENHTDTTLRRFVFRGLGWSTLIAVLLCLIYVIYDISKGEIGYLSIVMITVLVLFITIYTVLIGVRRKQMKDLLEKLKGYPVSYKFDDDELSSKSVIGSSSIKWEMIKKLWINTDLIMVFFANNAYITIPTDQIPREALSFLFNKVKSSGGVVTDKKCVTNSLT